MSEIVLRMYINFNTKQQDKAKNIGGIYCQYPKYKSNKPFIVKSVKWNVTMLEIGTENRFCYDDWE